MTLAAAMRSALTRRCEIGLAGIVIAGAALGLGCDSRSAEASSDSPANASADQPPPRISGPVWQAEQRYVYGVEMSSRLGMSGAATMVDFRLRGDLVIEARPHSAQATELASALPNVVFETSDQAARAEFDRVSQELKKPLIFTLTKGKLTELRPQPDWSRFAHSISRALADALQFAEHPPGAGAVWKTHEVDGTGEYEAEYRSLSGGQVTKGKVSYKPIQVEKLSLGQFSAQLTPEVILSLGTVVVTNEPAAADKGAAGGKPFPTLARLDYQEKLGIPMTGAGRVTSDTSLKLTLKRRERSMGAFDWQAAVSGTTPTSPLQRARVTNVRDAYDSSRIGDYTFAKALKELEQYAEDPKANALFKSVRNVQLPSDALREREALLRDQGRAFTAMAALLRSKPADMKLAVAKIRRGSPAKTALLDALASAGTPDAQRALVVLMGDARLDKSLRRNAVFSLIRTESATPEAVAALTRHVNDDLLRVHALYGLGTIGRRLRETGSSQRADEIVQTLIRALAEARTPAVRVHVLRGIANSGHSAALDSVRPFLGSAVTKERTAAVDAVRLMQHPEVDAIVAERLKNDVQTVQLAALDAVAIRQPSDILSEALEHAAQKAEKPAVRLKAVRILGDWLPKRPGLRMTLGRLSRESEYVQVREAAQRALGE